MVGTTEGLTDASSPSRTPTSRSRRRRRIVGLLLASLALLAVAGAIRISGSAKDDALALTATLDGPAPAFSLENVRLGEADVALADVLGRPVVMNLWASWCTPCRREMPALAAAHRRFGDRITFVGVNHQDTRDHAIDLLDETGVDYPSGYDPEGSVALDYGLFGMPTTIFISPEGELLERRTGEISAAELEATITRLFLSD